MRKLSSGPVGEGRQIKTEIEVFDTLDSTSLEAKRRAREIKRVPRWFVAHIQNAGYGRRGRAWTQARGDFAGSLIFRPKTAGDRLGQASFVAALAVMSALDEIVRPDLISLKWPNDVLLDGGKAAGLLLERIEDEQGTALVIGIGVNIVSAPRDLPYRATQLVDYSDDIPAPTELASRIDVHFWRYYADWEQNGFERIRGWWLERASGLGEAITIRLPREDLAGVFEGLDKDGALILRLAAGKRIISAGEAFFPPRQDKD